MIRGLLMPCASKRMRVWRVSSQARAFSSPSTRTARRVMSSRFPMGVAMTTSFATRRRSERVLHAHAEIVVDRGCPRAQAGVQDVFEGVAERQLQLPDRRVEVRRRVEPSLEGLLEHRLIQEVEGVVRFRRDVVTVVENRPGGAGIATGPRVPVKDHPGEWAQVE